MCIQHFCHFWHVSWSLSGRDDQSSMCDYLLRCYSDTDGISFGLAYQPGLRDFREIPSMESRRLDRRYLPRYPSNNDRNTAAEEGNSLIRRPSRSWSIRTGNSHTVISVTSERIYEYCISFLFRLTSLYSGYWNVIAVEENQISKKN